MNLKAIKPLYVLLTLTLLVSLIPILHVAGQGRPKIFVDPPENTFFSDTTPVGSTFTVSVKSSDWVAPGVYSYEFKVAFDKTMLNATAAGLPTGHWLTPTLSPTNIYIVDAGTPNNTLGIVSFAATLTSTEPGKTGGGTIATITFKIIASPPAAGNITSLIAIRDEILVDPSANQIPSANYDVVAATFTYAAPPPPWFLKIEPSLVVASAIGDHVTINVNFLKVAKDANIVGVQFKVLYPSMLTTLDITEGAFFSSFGTTAFAGFAESDEERAHGDTYATAFVMIEPPWTATTNFPEGNGTLATITFNVTGPLPATVTTYPFIITEVIIIAPTADFTDLTLLPYHHLEDGAIQAPLKLEDLNQDGKVDILDIAKWALAFGTTPTSLRWNPKADLNGDGRVNILDGVRIAIQFGDP